jgi:hypothetical protein
VTAAQARHQQLMGQLADLEATLVVETSVADRMIDAWLPVEAALRRRRRGCGRPSSRWRNPRRSTELRPGHESQGQRGAHRLSGGYLLAEWRNPMRHRIDPRWRETAIMAALFFAMIVCLHIASKRSQAIHAAAALLSPRPLARQLRAYRAGS